MLQATIDDHIVVSTVKLCNTTVQQIDTVCTKLISYFGFWPHSHGEFDLAFIFNMPNAFDYAFDVSMQLISI